MELRVDGLAVRVPEGITVLEACDLAGRYVPRLCTYPGLGCCSGPALPDQSGDQGHADEVGIACRLCAVMLEGGGANKTVLACRTPAVVGMTVTTEHPELHLERLERLAEILAGHPHICLTCPDRDGCMRDECTFGITPEARCCDEFGRCEFGKLVAYLDPDVSVPRRAVTVSRVSASEGRIRREPGLCVGCGRCLAVCSTSAAAGRALHRASDVTGRRRTVVPRADSLRASGCTFCGQCVMVCPTGAVTAPGEAGARWLEGWRKRVSLSAPIVPPDRWRPLTNEEVVLVPAVPGVLILVDGDGRVLRISGAGDLSREVAIALHDPAAAGATRFRVEPAPLFTQRESELLARFVQSEGHLPPGNDLTDDLFDDDADLDDLWAEDLDG